MKAGMQQGEGQGGQLPPQILADQLTLSQPGGADYAHHSTTCPPPDFWPLLHPCSRYYDFQKKNWTKIELKLR